jgi:hypothetical protein
LREIQNEGWPVKAKKNFVSELTDFRLPSCQLPTPGARIEAGKDAVALQAANGRAWCLAEQRIAWGQTFRAVMGLGTGLHRVTPMTSDNSIVFLGRDFWVSLPYWLAFVPYVAYMDCYSFSVLA